MADLWYRYGPMVGAKRVWVWSIAVVVALGAGCVEPPEAERDGGATCRSEADCNPNGLCGPIRLCVLGYCAQDTVFRACPGGYPDAASVGECLTYVNCNTATCGELVPCVANRCDRSATPLRIPCNDSGF